MPDAKGSHYCQHSYSTPNKTHVPSNNPPNYPHPNPKLQLQVKPC